MIRSFEGRFDVRREEKENPNPVRKLILEIYYGSQICIIKIGISFLKKYLYSLFISLFLQPRNIYTFLILQCIMHYNHSTIISPIETRKTKKKKKKEERSNNPRFIVNREQNSTLEFAFYPTYRHYGLLRSVALCIHSRGEGQKPDTD